MRVAMIDPVLSKPQLDTQGPKTRVNNNVFALTTLAMVAFAGNSLLCRVALRDTTIDPASFTFLRIAAGALVLSAIAVSTRSSAKQGLAGDWISAFALFAYAIAFSFAYMSLSAATGALLLFGSVQATMLGVGIIRGERLARRQLLGLGMAVAGLVYLWLPGLTAPPLVGSLLMGAAGIAWGVYSLRGKGIAAPTLATAGNFVRALPFAAVAWLMSVRDGGMDAWGVFYAVLSGAVASGLGYAIWYRVLPNLPTTKAAIVQLSVPVIASVGGIVLLSESMTPRLLIASTAILSGVAMVVIYKDQRQD